MHSILTAVFFMFLQLSSQNIGCYADGHRGKESNLWDTIKEVVNKAGELLNYVMKIVGYAMDAVLLLCSGLKSLYVRGKAFIDILEDVSGVSLSEILKYGVETVVFAGIIIKGVLFSLSLIGFGAIGITAGSIAAWFQSVWFGGTIGGITGWLFSALQSIGAAGLGTAGMAIITFFSGIVATLYDIGFGAIGITSGSIAAWFHSVWFGGTIGGITGWLFSALQSIGAAILGTAGRAIVTFFSGIIVTLYEYIF